MSIVKSGMLQNDLHRLSHAAFPLSFFILILLSDPEFLPEKLVISMPGITKGVQYALKHYGIQVDDLNVLKPFVGPPLSDSFKTFRSSTWIP